MGKQKILAVIDMQNDFIDGILGSKEARQIVPLVADKLAHSEGQYDMVVYTMDTHTILEYPMSQEGGKLPVCHCIFGTSGWELNPKIRSAMPSTAKQYSKSQFVGVDMARDIKCGSLDCENIEIEVVGLCTDICVISNALYLKAVMPEAEIVVDADCCAGTTPELHEKSLDVMESCQITIRREQFIDKRDSY